jgi:hypothetical protein
MNKMIRAVMALASFALCSALFAVSADVYVETGSMSLTVNGDRDADITVVNLDTNQTVANVTALTSGGGYSLYYTYYGSTASGVTLDNSSNQYATLSGLPPGNYRVTATSWGLQDFSSYSGGNWAEMDLYEPYYGSWVDINIGTS